MTIESLKKSKVVCHEFIKFGGINQKPRFLLGRKFKTISISDLLFGSNIFGGGSGIAARKEIFLTFPFDKSISAIQNLNSLKNISIENNKLKEEIKILKQWQSLSLKLINENKAYKELLNVNDDTFETLETARVINKAPNIFRITYIK